MSVFFWDFPINHVYFKIFSRALYFNLGNELFRDKCRWALTPNVMRRGHSVEFNHDFVRY